MWNLISVRLTTVFDRCTVCAKHIIGVENRLGCTRWYSLVTRLKWKLDSVRLEILLILTQDRCSACVERTIGSYVVLDKPDGTPR